MDHNMCHWIEGCSDQNLVGSMEWEKVKDQASFRLADQIKYYAQDGPRRQAILQLVGPHFKAKYLSNYTDDHGILEYPKMESKTRNEIMIEMKKWLEEQSSKAHHDISSNTNYMSKLQEEMESTVKAGIKKQTEKNHFKSSHSDVIGKGLSSIISSDPSAIHNCTGQFKQQAILVPKQLRPVLWSQYLTAQEHNRSANGEELIESFKNTISKELNHKHLNEAFHSNLSREIDHDVTAMFKESACLHSVNSETNKREICKILNVLQVFNRSYKRKYRFWAFVIQQGYLSNQKRSADSDVLSATLWLQMIIKYFLPTNEAISTACKNVWEWIIEADKELSLHIQQNLSNFSDAKDSRASSRSYSNTGINKNNASMKTPSDFISKWLKEGFASILRPVAAMFLWDQFFFHGWSLKSLQDACVILLGLLKPWFINATNHLSTSQVFLEEPGKLYTSDIRQAWLLQQKGCHFKDITPLNQNVSHLNHPKPPPSYGMPSLWLPYDKSKKEKFAQKKSLNEPFDFYIDAVRFLPDNATVVKVTGKILNLHLDQVTNQSHFLAISDLESHFRYPNFQFKAEINTERYMVNPDAVILLRVYTIEAHTKELVVLGSCLLNPFSNKHGKKASLRVGGHQVRLRQGLPNPEYSLEDMLSTHMDTNPIIPCTTLLLRIQPHNSEKIAAPHYNSHYYRSDACKPNKSEERVYKYYTESDNSQVKVKDVAYRLQGHSSDDTSLNKYIKATLNQKNSKVIDFPYDRFINYNKKNGLMILIDKATGIPIYMEGRFMYCLVQVFPGVNDSSVDTINFITEHLEEYSLQRAPDWSDPAKKLHIAYDEKVFLLVTLFGLKVKLGSDGKLTSWDGKDLKISMQNSLAWGVSPCFHKGAVFSGTHYIPLFKGYPSTAIIDSFRQTSVYSNMQNLAKHVKILDTASIEIVLWDGIFSGEECPPLPVHSEMLKISPNPRKYIQAKKEKLGPSFSHLLDSCVPLTQDHEAGKRKFDTLLKTKFKDMMNNALTSSGYDALV